MSELDCSTHALNLSASKQRYSFPRTRRFDAKCGALCESYYELPTTRTRRATSFGYGDKDMGLRKNNFPGAGTYDLQDSKPANNYNAVAFGVGREKMELAGPLGQLKFLGKLPGPGAYEGKDVRDSRGPSLKSRHPDHQFDLFAKNPGPGTYNHEVMGTRNYYMTSKFVNPVNRKISQVGRLQPVGKPVAVGPGNYEAVDLLNREGRYNQAKNSSVSSCVFGKSTRVGPVEKWQAGVPGPGQYKSFSGFG